MKKSKMVLILVLILLVGNLFFGIKYFSVKDDLKETQVITSKSILNEKILDFTSMFIEDVLKANKEVSFEKRLALETKVRDLGDKEIITQWENFTNSKTEGTAQDKVKKLLEVLIRKIKK